MIGKRRQVSGRLGITKSVDVEIAVVVVVSSYVWLVLFVAG